ncbi:MAG: hypothetical protein KIT17_25215, partial [Rubrivivax sp.]|nr:hypothetical protein [Rubrivivax sp.]
MLVAAQAIGVSHGIAHGLASGVGHGVAIGVAGGVAGGAAHGGAADEHGHADARFAGDARVAVPAAEDTLHRASGAERSAFDAHEEGGDTCRLLDQATHADALVDGASAAVQPCPVSLRAATTGAAPRGTFSAAFLARGPPAAAR